MIENSLSRRIMRLMLFFVAIAVCSFCSACVQKNEQSISKEEESAADIRNVRNVIFWNDWHQMEFADIDMTQNEVYAYYEKTDDPEQLYAFGASIYWVEDKEISYEENCAMWFSSVTDMAWELIMQDLGFIEYKDYPLDVYKGRCFLATLDQISAIEQAARYRGYVMRIMPLLSPELITDARHVLIERGYGHSVNDVYTVSTTAFEIRTGSKQVAVEIEFDN